MAADSSTIFPLILDQTADQDALNKIYISNLRQRFKNEINRLTKGGMKDLIGNRPYSQEMSFPLSYVYAWHWLRHNVNPEYRQQLLAGFKSPDKSFLMRLLIESESDTGFIDSYIDHLLKSDENKQKQKREITSLLLFHNGDREKLSKGLTDVWKSLNLFSRSYKIAYADIAREERDRYGDMLSEKDLERLKLVDELLDPSPNRSISAEKAGIIPAMGCPQTCRHCMFVWRPLKPRDPDPQKVYDLVNKITTNVLFTGGDLTKHMSYFYDSIRKMENVTTFAILLNGDFANNIETTKKLLNELKNAIDDRPSNWAKAHVLLQISFDDFHQEVILDKNGKLRERIPIEKVANIVEYTPSYYPDIQLALLHKQTGLNFSADIFSKGVFARLANNLGERGHQIRIVSTAASSREKVNPVTGKKGKLVKDINFTLSSHPEIPIFLTSSTVDSYGRASEMEEGEVVKEYDLLHKVLSGKAVEENFDIDLMFWFNGWVTLFNAVHICLGDHYKDGLEKIFSRQRKDPLIHALKTFDLSLLEFYSEIRSDLEDKIKSASGPHQFFHSLTEESEVRLHMTQRLINWKKSQ